MLVCLSVIFSVSTTMFGWTKILKRLFFRKFGHIIYRQSCNAAQLCAILLRYNRRSKWNTKSDRNVRTDPAAWKVWLEFQSLRPAPCHGSNDHLTQRRTDVHLLDSPEPPVNTKYVEYLFLEITFTLKCTFSTNIAAVFFGNTNERFVYQQISLIR